MPGHLLAVHAGLSAGNQQGACTSNYAPAAATNRLPALATIWNPNLCTQSAATTPCNQKSSLWRMYRCCLCTAAACESHRRCCTRQYNASGSSTFKLHCIAIVARCSLHCRLTNTCAQMHAVHVAQYPLRDTCCASLVGQGPACKPYGIVMPDTEHRHAHNHARDAAPDTAACM